MRYRPSVSFLIFDEDKMAFELNDFLYYDKYISETKPLKGATPYIAVVCAYIIEDYFWFDRVI